MTCKRCGGEIPNLITNYTPPDMLPELCEQCKEQEPDYKETHWSDE